MTASGNQNHKWVVTKRSSSAVGLSLQREMAGSDVVPKTGVFFLSFSALSTKIGRCLRKNGLKTP